MISFFKKLFSKNSSSPEEKLNLDLKITDLEKGYILEYDLRNWEVGEVTVYNWDNGVKEEEYTIFDGTDQLYLNYSKSDQKTSVYWKGNLSEVWELAREKMKNDEAMSFSTFIYQECNYHFLGQGYALVENSMEQFEMENWLFESDDEQKLVSFNKYEDGTMEVYVGKVLSKYAISKILARS